MRLHARFQARLGAFLLDAELDLPARGVSALFGPSGCGKTSLLRAMAGLERLPGGVMRVEDDVWQEGRDFLPVHQRGVGLVFQEASLFPHLDVAGNLQFARSRKAAGRPDLEHAVSMLGVDRLLGRRVDALSGGERQRVAIARALLASPRLLLMDEPLAALDAGSKEEILPFLESLFRELEIPVIYVSHNLDELARLADTMALMSEGRVVATGPLAEMITRMDLPLSHGRNAEAILEAVVLGHDEEDQLCQLEVSGGSLLVGSAPRPNGERLRVRVQARDVSLCLEAPAGSSILNILPVRVESLQQENGHRVTVRLACGKDVMLASVSRRSARQLDLKPGMALFAQIKAVALLS